MPISDTDGAVSMWCEVCSAAFYVIAESRSGAPYCGGEDVSLGYAVAIHYSPGTTRGGPR